MLNKFLELYEAEKLYGHAYKGKNITWYGEKGRVVKVPFDKSFPMWGNIFDEEKIKVFVERLKYENGNTHIDMPLVSPTIVDEQYIAEYLENPDEFYTYDPLDLYPILTFGDEGLDSYVTDKEEWFERNYYTKLSDILNDIKSIPSGDEEYDEEVIEYFDLYQQMEKRLAHAIETKSGSIGQIIFQLRDGNHRRVAAYLAGEPYFFALVISNDIQRKYDWLQEILI